MQYNIQWEGKLYPMRTGMDVAESAVILAATGISYGALEDVLNDPKNPKFVLGLQSIMWLMRTRNGETCDLLSLNFQLDDFMEALARGLGAAAGIPAPGEESPKKTVKRPPRERLQTPE